MKQGILIVLIVVILTVLGFFFLVERESDKNEINLTPTQVYFAQEIQASSIKRIGQPIEGFEPQILMQAFPGFIHADFDKVKSQQGEYQVSNGAIVFINTDSGPEHSAARAITEEGMGTLLENVAARFGLPFDTAEDVDVIILEIIGPSIRELLVGLWESTDDEKFTREFEEDGTITDKYAGDSDTKFVGEWNLLTDTKKEPIEIPDNIGLIYLKIITPEEVQYFSILEINDISLQLENIDLGAVLNFRKT